MEETEEHETDEEIIIMQKQNAGGRNDECAYIYATGRK